MKKSLLLNLPVVCLIALLAGCHQKPAAKPATAKYVDFVLTPDAAAKTVALQCTGSSSGKCSFAFAGGTPGDVMLDIGGTATITGVAPGGQYCYGLSKLDITTCHTRPIPDQKTTVNREQQPTTPAPASN